MAVFQFGPVFFDICKEEETSARPVSEAEVSAPVVVVLTEETLSVSVADHLAWGSPGVSALEILHSVFPTSWGDEEVAMVELVALDGVTLAHLLSLVEAAEHALGRAN